MKGLLWKDWYQVRSYMKTMYLIMLVVLAIWGMSVSDSPVFPISYAAIFLGILPISLLSYDQASGWTEYSLTLPMSRKTLVAEKYLIGMGCAVGFVLLGMAFVLMRALSGAAPEMEQFRMMLCCGFCTVLLMNALMLPLMYRFGAEKARMLYFLTFALGGLLTGGGAALLDPLENIRPALGLVAAAGVLIVLVLYAVSWRLSVAWYGRYRK